MDRTCRNIIYITNNSLVIIPFLSFFFYLLPVLSCFHHVMTLVLKRSLRVSTEAESGHGSLEVL